MVSVSDIVALRTPTSMAEFNLFRERATNHNAKVTKGFDMANTIARAFLKLKPHPTWIMRWLPLS